ncbi:MAG: kelch repeat-containing protein [Candidatus Limnocylindrales bacterium]
MLVLVVVLGGGAFAWLRLQPAGRSAPSVPPPTAPAPAGAASSAAAPLARVPASSQASASALAPGSGAAQASTTWQPTAPLAQARWGQGSATLADGRVLVVGGTLTTTSIGALASVELYDPASGSWQSLAPMDEARAYPLVVPLEDGRILVAGGARDKAPLASTEIFDPGTDSWSFGPSMTMRRSVFAGVRLADGRVLVVGGGTTTSSGPATRSAEIFDPAADRWTATAPMYAARAYPTATLLPDGRVLVVGGATTYAENGTVLGTAELFDPSRGTWSETGPLVVPVYGHSANLLPNGDVLVTGGWSSTAASAPAIATAQLYDPRSNSWTATAPMQVARADARAVVLPDGRVLVVGGLSADYTALGSVELYDPATASWTTLPSTVVAEWWGTLALLPSGNVLLAGGSADSAGSAPLRDAEVLELSGAGS